jgi:predicted transcriptional regulator
MVTMQVPLDDDVASALDALARKEGSSPEQLAARAVRALVERQEYLAAIDEGLSDVAAGRVVDGEQVDSFLEDWATSR